MAIFASRPLLLVLVACTALSTTVRAIILPLPLQLRMSRPRVLATPVKSSPSSNASRALPVFFFHGILSNASSAEHYARNLTAEGRTVVALNFCPERCSVSALQHQVQLAIKNLESIIQASPKTFQDGYIFVGHSQGGVLARAVLEEWDAHDVKALISLAGVQNGVFYGPQAADQLALKIFRSGFGSTIFPSDFVNFNNMSALNARGQFQYELDRLGWAHPEAQNRSSGFNLARSPALHEHWAATNPFLPVINNVNPCPTTNRSEEDNCRTAQLRRRDNFLRLEQAHFFASPDDGVVAPWQSSILAQYEDLSSEREIETKFEDLRIIFMEHTAEYRQDTYGLQTLMRRDGIFFHVYPNISHNCWVTDSVAVVDGVVVPCSFSKVYDEHVYPVLAEF
ncbi:hypothetical protein Poli38472_013335 [Pythium oligandrum]|uniref:Lysosomal thioesterase PPT2 n=1 Tax=Pythium oligandrum TaxID=41045 RepID=A0A8K1C755_PYTOL|nr:hypothetical protein Poli38472_013335 [Pythium oligandrum]|eukprot:TMW57861.1 hypothetical protein Poli38472_013335 [Pythium oligandrum]